MVDNCCILASVQIGTWTYRGGHMKTGTLPFTLNHDRTSFTSAYLLEYAVWKRDISPNSCHLPTKIRRFHFLLSEISWL